MPSFVIRRIVAAGSTLRGGDALRVKTGPQPGSLALLGVGR